MKTFQRPAAAQDDDYGPVVALALLSGMRLGEVAELQWQDVDWDRNTISVRRSVQRMKGYGLAPASTSYG